MTVGSETARASGRRGPCFHRSLRRRRRAGAAEPSGVPRARAGAGRQGGPELTSTRRFCRLPESPTPEATEPSQFTDRRRRFRCTVEPEVLTLGTPADAPPPPPEVKDPALTRDGRGGWGSIQLGSLGARDGAERKPGAGKQEVTRPRSAKPPKSTFGASEPVGSTTVAGTIVSCLYWP